MAEYMFSYKRGRVTATHSFSADSDRKAFEKRDLFVRMFTVKYVGKSMQVCDQHNRWHFLSKAKEAKRRQVTLQAAE